MQLETSGTIQKTIDGGTTWYYIESGTTSILNAVYFINVDTGFVVGSSTILKTMNGGETWDEYPNTSWGFGWLTDIEFTDEFTGYITGMNTLLKTTDCGQTWINSAVGPGEYFTAISFPSGSIGYAGGHSFNLYKTTDSGETWIKEPANHPMSITSTFFVTPEIGYLFGHEGIILKTESGGTVGLQESNPFKEKVAFYPNPAKNLIVIDLIAETCEVIILDICGKEINTVLVDKSDNQLNIGYLKSGVYLLKLKNDSSITLLKMVKE